MKIIHPFRRLVKQAVCESRVRRHPVAPCELLPAGLAGVLEINGTIYQAEILGYLPEQGEPVVDGYRLTKDNGEAHDICLVAGRLECSCGDWIWRRSFQTDRVLADCKHCLAVRKHFVAPVDQNLPSWTSSTETRWTPPPAVCWPSTASTIPDSHNRPAAPTPATSPENEP